MSLDDCRNALNEHLQPEGGALFQRKATENWGQMATLVKNWWGAYKHWEKEIDTFNAAVEDDRMTLRTFSKKFTEEVDKTFKKGSLGLDADRFFQDSRYSPVDDQGGTRKLAFDNPEEKKHYGADRGIDGSAFAVPENFASREAKYKAGTHDLSASLFNHNFVMFDKVGGGRKQNHHTEDGAHFVFLPLSKEDDQEVIFNLVRAAKALRGTVPDLYALVRDYRSKMTRVKLAADFDMGVGYTAVPSASTAKEGPRFKLRYGLVASMTQRGVGGNGQQTVSVTTETYQARQQAGIRFKSILAAARGRKNEIVVAVRQHAGAFPVYAERKGMELHCFRLDGKKKVFTGGTVSAKGVLTGAGA